MCRFVIRRQLPQFTARMCDTTCSPRDATVGDVKDVLFEPREITLDDVKDAYARISPYVETTPVVTSAQINHEQGRAVYFKCENMQRTGSFKIRGAMNAILQLLNNNDGEVNGLVTQSSGNHGLAVAVAARTFGLACTVVSPRTTCRYKLEAIAEQGAQLVLCEPDMESRVKHCRQVQEKTGYHYISSCDDYDVITGQATLGLEFLEQVPDLDAILVTVSGGGMAAGTCLVARHKDRDVKVFTAEPPGKDLERCLRTGKRLWPQPPRYLDTVCEGLRVQQIGQRNWPILLDSVQRQVFTVQDEDSIRGLQYAFKMFKVVVEESAGAAVAAALSPGMRSVPGVGKLGVVLCGGNVDVVKLQDYLVGVQDVTFA